MQYLYRKEKEFSVKKINEIEELIQRAGVNLQALNENLTHSLTSVTISNTSV